MNNLIRPTLFIFFLTFFIAPNAVLADCKFEKIIQGEELPIGIMLDWSTCMEESNSMFIIERSDDGISFTNIGAVKGSGNSKTLHEYNFLDINARAEQIYYRLRQIDFDGSFSFSQVLSVSKKTPNNFMIAHMSSITAVKSFEVTIDAFKSGQLTYELIDQQGNTIMTKQKNVVNGSNKVSIPLNSYQENIYRLKLVMQSEEETLTFKKISEEENRKLHFANSKDCKTE